MPQLDQFESTFRAAAKETYTHTPLKIDRVLVATDLEAAEAALLTEAARRFLAAIDGDETVWAPLAGDAFDSVQALLERVEEHRPDLVVTYRHLHSNAWRWPYSLGEHLDVLTQATTTPILVLPHPTPTPIAPCRTASGTPTSSWRSPTTWSATPGWSTTRSASPRGAEPAG